jgi:hypothetical protein
MASLGSRKKNTDTEAATAYRNLGSQRPMKGLVCFHRQLLEASRDI